MRIYFTFSRGYALVLCWFLLIAFSVLSIASDSKPKVTLENEAQRASFIKQYEILAGDPLTVKNVTVPLSFDRDFEQYSNILKSGGYDLDEYKGKCLTEYTYSAEDGLRIYILTDGEKLVGAHCIDLKNGSIHLLAGEKIGTDKTG